MAIDWSKAPDGAEFYARGRWFKRDCFGRCLSIHHKRCGFLLNDDPREDLTSYSDYEPRPAAQQWPETEERINNIGRNRTGDDMGHYDDIREQQAQSAAPLTNKYDRTIIGKYATGKCVVDVYRVLNAFPTGSPEIDHALKKLLAAGKRGAKDELQDLREAVQSIEARIDYLMELQGEK